VREYSPTSDMIAFMAYDPFEDRERAIVDHDKIYVPRGSRSTPPGLKVRGNIVAFDDGTLGAPTTVLRDACREVAEAAAWPRLAALGDSVIYGAGQEYVIAILESGIGVVCMTERVVLRGRENAGGVFEHKGCEMFERGDVWEQKVALGDALHCLCIPKAEFSFREASAIGSWYAARCREIGR
jgi:hypothetical protein